MAAGVSFYGKATMPGRAVCLFAEDAPEALHIRLARLCEATGIDMADVAGRLMPLSLLDDPPADRVLWASGRPTMRLAVLERELAALPDLRLLVLDNVTLMFDGEEINRKDVGGFLVALTGLARRLKIGIILVHHASKSQDGTSLRMASGSTAWIAQCRAAAEMRKATGEDGPRFAVRKINNGREWNVDLRWTDAGALVPVVEATGAVAGIERRGHEQAFLDCLAAVTAQGRTVSEVRNSPRYAPKVFATMSEAKGVKKHNLEKAMEALFSAGVIRVGEVGKSDQRKPISSILRVQDMVCDCPI